MNNKLQPVGAAHGAPYDEHLSCAVALFQESRKKEALIKAK